MFTLDFRNRPVLEAENLLTKCGFNERKINNFKKALREQSIQTLSDIKKVRRLELIIPHLPFKALKPVKQQKDSTGNEKYLFKTHDDLYIESVLMPDKKKKAICVSVQVGCRFKCRLCQTGFMGFTRNLWPHEILDQIRQIFVNSIYPSTLSCISFMGMGEPLDNLKNAMLACEWINSNWGWQVSYERITFSTSGCLGLEKFLPYPRLPNLAVSLHSADQKKRNKLMPAAKISLKKLKKEMLKYTHRTKNQISIEYCLIKNFNDSRADILKLIDYVKDLPCKINLLNYNNTTKGQLLSVDQNKIKEVKALLKAKKIPVLYRKSLGTEIRAGCGQLGYDLINNKKPLT